MLILNRAYKLGFVSLSFTNVNPKSVAIKTIHETIGSISSLPEPPQLESISHQADAVRAQKFANTAAANFLFSLINVRARRI